MERLRRPAPWRRAREAGPEPRPVPARRLRRPVGGQLRDVLLDQGALALLVEGGLDEAPGRGDGEIRHLALQLRERLRLLLLNLLAGLGDERLRLLARLGGEVGAQDLHLLLRLVRERRRLALRRGERRLLLGERALRLGALLLGLLDRLVDGALALVEHPDD